MIPKNVFCGKDGLRVKNKITANIGLKIASLFFAFMLWMVVNNINDPTIDRSFSNIPVKLINTELITDSGQVYEILDNSAVIDKVTVWAPRSISSSLNASNIVAVADVSELSSLDTITIKLSTNLYSSEIEKIQGSNDTVRLNIENQRTKALALKATVSGEVEEGYLVGDIITDQNLVRISGPESVVNEITKAVVDVPVTGFISDISDNAEIRLYDSNDNLIRDTRITQSIKTVGVTVNIYKTLEVPVYLSTTGTPAEGYRVAGEVQSSISSVTLAGKENILKNITAIEIPGEAIDITEQSEDYTAEIDIREYLPENTFLADTSQSRIEVIVDIQPEVSKELEIQGNRVEVTNVPEGYRASIPEFEENIVIEVVGLSSDISEIRSYDVRGTVDISKWMAEENMTEPVEGYYQVEIDFGLSDRVTVKEPVVVTMHLSKLED
ncbi:MAG: YbbR-like domain-containing protein [Suilimivivens sp.]